MSHEQKLPDITEIQALIPHRYPFLLVDKVVSINYDKRTIVATKNVSINEPFFQGHFPGQPIMPGVLIIEAMAQAGGVLTQLTLGRDAQSKLFYMVKVDKARFSKQVVPGDVLEMHVEIKRVIRNMAVYDCVAKVDGEIVACAEVLCAGTRE
ncbi:3-hydroxyacyl-ACP dehydratase FabZ [Stenotrophomonas sp. NPDC101269]|uniref:3-hydroxyacyl-ACP dehydratase FabZ n=1 Tax=Stenotrophomonas TaxID=40323 RepID=UPI00030158AE|nr:MULTISPECIES: 3-hydroxyacyl-ACP dehydratase FabZ [Stenotrophomonas]